ALLRSAVRPSALAVDGTRRGWVAAVASEGEPAAVERAMLEAVRAAERSAAQVDRADDPEPVLAPLRDLPATATDGALVRASLPLAAQRSFVEAAAALEAFDRCVADAGAGVMRVHLRGDDADVLLGADTLMAGARSVGGSARIERREEALRGRLPAWGPPPGGDFLMKRIRLAFDPAGTLEPGRGIVR
ncbi:MAG: hypothetical protein ACRDGT_07235, partial [Candidatus Limnocylindria bacterium]